MRTFCTCSGFRALPWIPIVLLIQLVVSYGILGCGVLECDPDLGVCPRPDVGVIVDDGHIEKSVWTEAPFVGPPETQGSYSIRPNLCVADLDRVQGDEVIFKGRDGFALFVGEASSPHELTRVRMKDLFTPSRPVLFVDVDRDGDAEYLRPPAYLGYNTPRLLRLTNHDGDGRWQRAVDILTSDLRDILDEQFFIRGDWAAADIDSDGILEFAVTTANGVDIFRADGTPVATVGNQFYSHIAFANMDGEDVLELITRSGDVVATWSLDGRMIASFECATTVDCWYGRVARISPEDKIDRIRILSDLYDAEGNQVDGLSSEPFGSSSANNVNYMDAFLIAECHESEDTRVVERWVRFERDAEAYRVELSYSYRTQLPFMAGVPLSNPTRCILRVFDANANLVYHEVISSKSAPASVAVIPSDVEGREMLLVADDTRILAYRFRDTAGNR